MPHPAGPVRRRQLRPDRIVRPAVFLVLDGGDDMRKRGTVATVALIVAGMAGNSGAAEEVKVVREVITIESHKLVGNEATRRLETLPQTVAVTVYRPDDGQKHPAIVYLHGGGMSFADPSMVRFHVELVRRGLVVLAPHYLLDGTGWPHWNETAVNTVTLATSLPSVDPGRIGMAGISMGGQVGLSTAARDPRVKKVAEFFTAWPGSLPDEPIDKLPPVLLLNGTVDQIIPLEVALELDGILKERGLPFVRHLYEGVGHGFCTAAAFEDGVNRTALFFGGSDVESAPMHPSDGIGLSVGAGLSPFTDGGFFEVDFGYEFFFVYDPYSLVRMKMDVRKKKSKRLVGKNSAHSRSGATQSQIAKP
jgi:acetyl esterase/lipase